LLRDGEGIYNDLLRNNIGALVTEEITVDSAITSLLEADLVNRLDKLH